MYMDRVERLNVKIACKVQRVSFRRREDRNGSILRLGMRAQFFHLLRFFSCLVFHTRLRRDLPQTNHEKKRSARVVAVRGIGGQSGNKMERTGRKIKRNREREREREERRKRG